MVNWFTAQNSLRSGCAQSIRRTKSPRVSPSFWYCTGTPAVSSLWKRPVRRQQRGNRQFLHLLHRVFARSRGHVRIQPLDGLTQSKRQQHLPVVRPLRVGAVMGNVRAVAVRVAQLGEPAQGFLFELVFGHGATRCCASKMPLSATFT